MILNFIFILYTLYFHDLLLWEPSPLKEVNLR